MTVATANRFPCKSSLAIHRNILELDLAPGD